MTIRGLIQAQPLNIIGTDHGSDDETAVAVIKTQKGGFMEVIDVKYGDEARAILRALEGGKG
jgi:hypothetical protein